MTDHARREEFMTDHPHREDFAKGYWGELQSPICDHARRKEFAKGHRGELQNLLYHTGGHLTVRREELTTDHAHGEEFAKDHWGELQNLLYNTAGHLIVRRQELTTDHARREEFATAPYILPGVRVCKFACGHSILLQMTTQGLELQSPVWKLSMSGIVNGQPQ